MDYLGSYSSSFSRELKKKFTGSQIENYFKIHSPGKYEILSDIYSNAEKAGKKGADCVSLYPKCPKGSGLLDKISVMI
jgi:hypothetical protein